MADSSGGFAFSHDAWKQRIRIEEKALQSHIRRFYGSGDGSAAEKTYNPTYHVGNQSPIIGDGSKSFPFGSSFASQPNSIASMERRMAALENDLLEDRKAREQMLQEMQAIKDVVMDLRTKFRPSRHSHHRSRPVSERSSVTSRSLSSRCSSRASSRNVPVPQPETETPPAVPQPVEKGIDAGSQT